MHYVQISLAGLMLAGPIASSAANTTIHCIMDNPDQLEAKYLFKVANCLVSIYHYAAVRPSELEKLLVFRLTDMTS